MRIGIYLADQSWSRTLSKGIYTYSRLLVEEATRRLPQHEWVLIVNRSNRDDMVAASAPATVVELPDACASGLRLAADHLAGPLLAWRRRLDVLHYPKGWLPLVASRAALTATIHDTIPLHYERAHPGFFAKTKLTYLRRLLVRGLRVSHAIATDSAYSRDCLLRLASEEGLRPPPLFVCPLSPHPDLWADAQPSLEKREQLVHLGSRLPHKRTRDTIRLFRAWNRRQHGCWRLRIVGLRQAPAEWRHADGDDVQFLGPLATAALRRELLEARALLLLSEVEGFGLPALESWFLGTPVCYSPGGALGEVLDGMPGRCAALDEGGFTVALDAILALDSVERALLSSRLRGSFGPEAFGRRVQDLFAQWLATLAPQG